MPRIDLTIEIAATARVVYALAKDVERFPEYMPDVERVTVTERRGEVVISEWSTIVEDATIEWTEEDRFDDARARIEYRAIDGDLERFEGVWSFDVMPGDATRVALSIDYDFGVPALAELIGPTLDSTVRRNGEMMLAALKSEAERRSR